MDFPYLACNDRNAFLLQKNLKNIMHGCVKMCDTLTFLLDNTFIRFGTKLYRQVVGIPMRTNCAPLVADLFLFCYERDFMMSLSDDTEAAFLDLYLSISNDIVSTKIYDKRDDFDLKLSISHF